MQIAYLKTIKKYCPFNFLQSVCKSKIKGETSSDIKESYQRHNSLTIYKKLNWYTFPSIYKYHVSYIDLFQGILLSNCWEMISQIKSSQYMYPIATWHKIYFSIQCWCEFTITNCSSFILPNCQFIGTNINEWRNVALERSLLCWLDLWTLWW